MEMLRTTPTAGQELAAAADQPGPRAALNAQGRVKLRLSSLAYQEALDMVGLLAPELRHDVLRAPRLGPETADNWAALALLDDLWEYQLKEYQHRAPDLVTVVLSRTEAMLLWKLWAYLGMEPHVFPAWGEVMNETQHLLG